MDTDHKIAIIGHIDVDPAVRDELVASVAELQRATRNDEPGCLVYLIAADPAEPGRIQIVELWDSAESADVHFQHPNFFATGEALRSVERRGGGSRKYRIDAEDDVRGDDGAATSRFRDTSAE
jgi:quinol monooxygenase YgiN